MTEDVAVEETEVGRQDKGRGEDKDRTFWATATKMAFRPIKVRSPLYDYGQRNSSTATLVSGERSRFSPEDKKEEEVIVALIDDGVDNTHPPLVGKILPGETFAYNGDRVRPWFVSESGHDTIMASMICRVCPMAKIYPIRLNMLGQRTIDVKSAAPVCHNIPTQARI